MTKKRMTAQDLARQSAESRTRKPILPECPKQAPESTETSPFFGEIVRASWGEEIIVDEMGAICTINWIEGNGKRFRMADDGFRFHLEPKADTLETWLIRKHADMIRSVLLSIDPPQNQESDEVHPGSVALEFCRDAAEVCRNLGDERGEAKWAANAKWLENEMKNPKSRTFSQLQALNFESKKDRKEDGKVESPWE